MSVVGDIWARFAARYHNRLMAVGQFAILALLVLLVIRQWLPPTLRPAPVTFDRVEYAADITALCPGDNLVYRNVRTVHRTATVKFQRTWYSVAEQRTVVREDIIEQAVYPGERATEWVIPLPVLPPGDYRYEFAVWEEGSEASAMYVPFHVRSDC